MEYNTTHHSDYYAEDTDGYTLYSQEVKNNHNYFQLQKKLKTTSNNNSSNIETEKLDDVEIMQKVQNLIYQGKYEEAQRLLGKLIDANKSKRYNIKQF